MGEAGENYRCTKQHKRHVENGEVPGDHPPPAIMRSAADEKRIRKNPIRWGTVFFMFISFLKGTESI